MASVSGARAGCRGARGREWVCTGLRARACVRRRRRACVARTLDVALPCGQVLLHLAQVRREHGRLLEHGLVACVGRRPERPLKRQPPFLLDLLAWWEGGEVVHGTAAQARRACAWGAGGAAGDWGSRQEAAGAAAACVRPKRTRQRTEWLSPAAFSASPRLGCFYCTHRSAWRRFRPGVAPQRGCPGARPARPSPGRAAWGPRGDCGAVGHLAPTVSVTTRQPCDMPAVCPALLWRAPREVCKLVGEARST